MNTTIQRRARAGGEVGANGEWYEGGKFIATREDTVKVSPPAPRVLTPEERAAKDAQAAADLAKGERVRAWVAARREVNAEALAELRRPGWVDMWGNVLQPATNFHVRLAWHLEEYGCLTPRQAECVAKKMIGRRNKGNAADWDRLVNQLTEVLQ